MEENSNSIGDVLLGIRHGDKSRQLRYNEETGDFEIVTSDTHLEEGSQDATPFAAEGFA